MSEKNRLIVLTGCTRGLGRALVPGLIAAGHRVIGCGTKAEIISAQQTEYSSAGDFSVVDVTDATAVAAWAQRVITSHGVPDLVLNNAAVINRTAPVWKITPDEFAHLFQVNVLGVHHVMRAFLPAMIERRRGLIVNFSSGWGRSTSPEVAPYCASKFAIEGLSQAAAQEVPAGLGIIPLSPGVIDTEMLRSCWSGGASSYPTPEQWAKKAVPFLLRLGPEHNGQSLSID
jgi:NAD(P)-dependent dehydrogenase (short-subunit alcohol dehydrogenase family)